jgi:polyvinyl alcohol dehydrogenase (cytochrome)
MIRMLLLRLTFLLSLGIPLSAQTVSGEAVYRVRCASCDDADTPMASDGKNVYAATSDVVRRGAAGYDPKHGGGLTALRIADGQRAWYAAPPPCDAKQGCSPAQSVAVTAIPGVVFSGSLDGHLRAFSPEDGKVIWDFDTVHEFKTVNGVKASGGGVDGPGPVVVDSMVLVGSGYARTGGMGGNVLLAFTPEEAK